MHISMAVTTNAGDEISVLIKNYPSQTILQGVIDVRGGDAIAVAYPCIASDMWGISPNYNICIT